MFPSFLSVRAKENIPEHGSHQYNFYGVFLKSFLLLFLLKYSNYSLQTMGGSPGELSEELCSFSNLSVTSPTSQIILQPFRCFTYVTAHSPTVPLLHLRQSSYSNPSFASPTSQALHLIYLASRPCWRRLDNNFWEKNLCHSRDSNHRSPQI